MALFEKKQELSQGSPKEKIPPPPKEKAPPPKEEKKDTSIFGGKPSLKREELRQWLRREETWEITKIPREERPGLEKKLFDPKRFGELIDQKEAKKIHDELKDFPIKSKEKYGIKSESERLRMLKLLEEKFLGK